MKPDVVIYCDGSADKEGHGGCAAVLIGKKRRRNVFQPFPFGATNQKMEIMAAILGLSYLTQEGVRVRLISDSKYVIDAYNEGWVKDWKRKNWRKGSRREVMNIDLWKTLDAHVALQKVEFVWVKGHNGNAENEYCDMLANVARERAIRAAQQEEYRAAVSRVRAGVDSGLIGAEPKRRRTAR